MWSSVELVSRSNQEKALRAVARKHEIPLLDAEKIYKHFRRYDVDGGGTIDREEFRHVVQDMSQPRTVRRVSTRDL